MKTLAAFSLALALTASGTTIALAQGNEPDRGPSAYKSGETVNGEITKIDPATKTIEVKPANAMGATTTLEYQAKDSTELGKFHVGQTVSGKVSKDTPPKLTNLKPSSEKKSSGAGMSPSSSPSGGGMTPPPSGGGMGGADTARSPAAPR
jgi:hypothetical protein